MLVCGANKIFGFRFGRKFRLDRFQKIPSDQRTEVMLQIQKTRNYEKFEQENKKTNLSAYSGALNASNILHQQLDLSHLSPCGKKCGSKYGT